MNGDLRRAVLLSFDNLGEAADLEREQDVARVDSHPSVTHALPWLLDTLSELELHATFFVEAINAELYPDALRDIAAAGHEIGMHAWRHERWDALSPDEEDELLDRSMRALRGLGLEVDGFRPPGGAIGARTPAALRSHGIRWCSPLGTNAHLARSGLVCLPFRWPLVDAYHRMEAFADRRARLGDRPRASSPRETADALLEGLAAPSDTPTVLIMHPFLMLEPAEMAEARRVLAWLAEQAASGARWVAPGRDLAAQMQLTPARG